MAESKRGFLQGRPPRTLAYQTKLGRMYHGKSEDVLRSSYARSLEGSVQLIFTSPPFPLNTKKRYGNLSGDEYVEWLADFAPRFRELLCRNGSLVVELGNAWEPGRPVMSTLALRALLRLQERGVFHLCQEVIWHNPARLPTPAQWVNVDRIRLKDSFTRFWWLSVTDRPKADNRRVLADYSPSMKKLLERGTYNSGRRPSEHRISKTAFLSDNGGAIAPSVLIVPNTRSSDAYHNYCRTAGLQPHPARMPRELAEFFIRFLSDPGDLVLDPFAGSNTTGAVAEELGRHWVTVEPDESYVVGSMARFDDIRTVNRGLTNGHDQHRLATQRRA